MAARFRVIILDKGREPDAQKVFRYVLWADVPAARQPFYAQPAGTKSAWKDAVQADNDQLISGAVTEKLDTINGQTGWNLAAYEAELQIRWQAFQDDVTTNNPWNRYGTTWNGTAWAIGGVA